MPAGRAGERRSGGISSKATRQTPAERDRGQGQGWGRRRHPAQPGTVSLASLPASSQTALPASLPLLSSLSALFPHNPAAASRSLPLLFTPTLRSSSPARMRSRASEVLTFLGLRPYLSLCLCYVTIRIPSDCNKTEDHWANTKCCSYTRVLLKYS